MNPRVTSVVPERGFRLTLRFTNGEVGIFDCSSLLDFGVFQELRDPDYLGQVVVAGRTVVWPHDQDICPDTLYGDSQRGDESPPQAQPHRLASLDR